ncbi:MAG: nucleotidyltransferase family protein [Lyngbya sp. HA4199-MV5]|nr:nucleotidyltransferase family protein [Lyngbya sp. HA4199-MV5]
MFVQTKAQVLALLQEYRQELRQFGVSRCGLFGSFVRDTNVYEQSDVDILVAFEPDQKTFDNFMHLSFFLEELFGRSVDLVTIESLSPYIGPRILDEVEYVSISS